MAVLYGGLDRQGPGDDAFSVGILRRLPPLRPQARILDLGCGTGAGSLVLQAFYGGRIDCVDRSPVFLAALRDRARARGLEDRIVTHEADMGDLDLPCGSVDLIWSEGAAYTLTFRGALERWRPLLRAGGCAVVSEMGWFGDARPTAAAGFWSEAYPEMKAEAENVGAAAELGFDALFVERLPSDLWWANYYDPLLSRADRLEPQAPPALREAIEEARAEARVFRGASDAFGYTFYALAAR